MKNKNALIIFAKLPVEGKVKTRLAKDLGNEAATGFYKACSENIFSEVRKSVKKLNIVPHLYCTEKDDIVQMKRWIGDDFIFDYQQGDNLGLRMANAFSDLFYAGFEKIMIVGTDIPDVNVELLETAFSKLEEFDVVIGPSNDGGYYLLGLKQFVPALFENIEWSTKEVFKKTMNSIKQNNLNCCQLKTLIDIDTINDLQKWMKSFSADTSHPVKSYIERKIKQTDFLT